MHACMHALLMQACNADLSMQAVYSCNNLCVFSFLLLPCLVRVCVCVCVRLGSFPLGCLFWFLCSTTAAQQCSSKHSHYYRGSSMMMMMMMTDGTGNNSNSNDNGKRDDHDHGHENDNDEDNDNVVSGGENDEDHLFHYGMDNMEDDDDDDDDLMMKAMMIMDTGREAEEEEGRDGDVPSSEDMMLHHDHDHNVDQTMNEASTRATSTTGNAFQQFTMIDPDHFGGTVHDVQQAKKIMNRQGYPSEEQDAAAAAGGGGGDHGKHTVPPTAGLTGRFPILMYLSCDAVGLSPFQCLMRQQIEFFEALEVDVNTKIQGRNKPIVLGQVGIRCVHCKHLLLSHNEKKSRAAMYYPSTLLGVYQAAQVLCSLHLMGSTGGGDDDDAGGAGCSSSSSSNGCPYVPQQIRQNLFRLKMEHTQQTATKKRNTGKQYWADASSELGVYEDTTMEILRFRSTIGHFVCPKQHHDQM